MRSIGCSFGPALVSEIQSLDERNRLKQPGKIVFLRSGEERVVCFNMGEKGTLYFRNPGGLPRETAQIGSACKFCS